MTHALALFVFAAVGALVVGCSTSSTEGSSGGSSSASSGTSGSPGTMSLTGTIAGKPFAARSALGEVADNGALNLIFSNEDGVCDSAKAGKVHPGETLVQIYGLKGTVPGAFTPEHDDVKYATVNVSCASGAAIDDMQIESASRATKKTITVTTLTAALTEGTVDVEFDDGSTVTGSFSVPMCVTSTAEGATCY